MFDDIIRGMITEERKAFEGCMFISFWIFSIDCPIQLLTQMLIREKSRKIIPDVH